MAAVSALRRWPAAAYHMNMLFFRGPLWFSFQHQQSHHHPPVAGSELCAWHASRLPVAVENHIAAKYCDVISFNRYRFAPNDLQPHDKNIDKPIIIGEFHFGALDRGMLHTGLRSVQNQEQRGKAYYAYIKAALENPYLVGAHWFQYGEQAVTGRGDGENYQIGFLDVCDTPYRETIDACRKIGYKMYEIRMQKEQ